MTQTIARYELYSFRNRSGFLSQPPVEFELGWREHPPIGPDQAGVPALGVVEALDEVEDLHPRLSSRVKDLAIEQLALESGEERLRHGVGVGVQLHLLATVR